MTVRRTSPGRDLGRGIRGSVVGNDRLQIHKSLPEDGGDRLLQEALAVIDRQADADDSLKTFHWQIQGSRRVDKVDAGTNAGLKSISRGQGHAGGTNSSSTEPGALRRAGAPSTPTTISYSARLAKNGRLIGRAIQSMPLQAALMAALGLAAGFAAALEAWAVRRIRARQASPGGRARPAPRPIGPGRRPPGRCRRGPGTAGSRFASAPGRGEAGHRPGPSPAAGW